MRSKSESDHLANRPAAAALRIGVCAGSAFLIGLAGASGAFTFGHALVVAGVLALLGAVVSLLLGTS